MLVKTKKPRYLNHLKPQEIRSAIKENPLILIPLGTTEWHAPHLPVGVDSLLSQAICADLSAQAGCVIAPPLATGICRNLTASAGYFGTVETIRNETLTALLVDLGNGYAKLGFKTAAVITGHFENDHWSAIKMAIHSLSAIRMVMLGAYDFLADKVQELDSVEKTWPYATDHAAEWETSMMLHYYPHLVDMEQVPEKIILPMEDIPSYIHTRFPRRASPDYGKQLANATIQGGLRMINALLAEIE